MFLRIFLMCLDSWNMSSSFPPQGLNKQFSRPKTLLSKLYVGLALHFQGLHNPLERQSLISQYEWVLFPFLMIIFLTSEFC